MKVLFLDYNGVIDTWQNFDEINPDNLQRLKKILEATGAKVVISSSTKTSYFYTGHFNPVFIKITKGLIDAGIEVIDITPLASSKDKEIELYLINHPEVKEFCILDDEGKMEQFKEHFVKLPVQSAENPNGLSDEHVKQAISILNRNIKKEQSPILKKTKS